MRRKGIAEKEAAVAIQVYEWRNFREYENDKNTVYLPRQYINKNLRMLDIPYFFVVGRYCLLPTYYFFIIYASTRYKTKN